MTHQLGSEALPLRIRVDAYLRQVSMRFARVRLFHPFERGEQIVKMLAICSVAKELCDGLTTRFRVGSNQSAAPQKSAVYGPCRDSSSDVAQRIPVDGPGMSSS